MSTCLQKQNRYDVGTTKRKPKHRPPEKESSPKTSFWAPQFFLRNTLLQIKRILSLDRKSAAAADDVDD